MLQSVSWWSYLSATCRRAGDSVWKQGPLRGCTPDLRDMNPQRALGLVVLQCAKLWVQATFTIPQHRSYNMRQDKGFLRRCLHFTK